MKTVKTRLQEIIDLIELEISDTEDQTEDEYLEQKTLDALEDKIEGLKSARYVMTRVQEWAEGCYMIRNFRQLGTCTHSPRISGPGRLCFPRRHSR
jgi:hypothetical protein